MPGGSCLRQWARIMAQTIAVRRLRSVKTSRPRNNGLPHGRIWRRGPYDLTTLSLVRYSEKVSRVVSSAPELPRSNVDVRPGAGPEVLADRAYLKFFARNNAPLRAWASPK